MLAAAGPVGLVVGALIVTLPALGWFGAQRRTLADRAARSLVVRDPA
jgi:hypothetical protein